MNELEGDELEATLLEAADDVADESTLDTVGLDTNEARQRTCSRVRHAARRLLRTFTMMYVRSVTDMAAVGVG